MGTICAVEAETLGNEIKVFYPTMEGAVKYLETLYKEIEDNVKRLQIIAPEISGCVKRYVSECGDFFKCTDVVCTKSLFD